MKMLMVIWKYVIICTVAFIINFNTLYGTFVFDDTEAIVKNRDIHPTTSIINIFKNDFWGTDITLNKSHKSYRPITILTYRVNYMVSDYKLDAFQFHLTNVILYVVLCMIALKCLLKFSKNDSIAFYATLLFTVHPVHTEAVASLVGRADILSGILFLITILIYEKAIRNQSKSQFILALIMVFIAVLCKETAITALGICVVFDVLGSNILFSQRVEHVFKHKALAIRFTIMVFYTMGLLYFRWWIMNFEGPTFTSIDNPAAYSQSLFTKIFTYNYIYILNVLILLLPLWLCFDWSMGCVPLINDVYDIRLIYVVAFWIVLIFIIYKIVHNVLHKKNSVPLILGISLMIIPFVPAMNLFIKVGFVIAERTLLIPSLGYCYLVILGYEKLKDKRKFLMNFGFCLIIGLCSLRTIQRNNDWITEKRLFSSALDVCPLNAKVHYNIAKVAADEKNVILAKNEYRRAIELNSEYEQAMNNLANILRDEKEFNEAETLLRKALDIRPNFAAAWMNLGIVLTNLNKGKEAELCYLQAITFRNKYPDCYYNLGNLYLDMKENENALASWRKAVEYKPTHTAAWSNMLVLLDTLAEYDKVIELGKESLRYNPNSAALYFCLANTLGKMHRFEEAESHFHKATQLNPKNGLYFSNFGVLYHRWGKMEKAKEYYKKALELDSTLKTTEANLMKLMK